MGLFWRSSNYSMVLTSWVTAASQLPVPGTVPSHWSLWKVGHTGLRGQNPGQDPSSWAHYLLLHAAYNVALTSLWELWGFSSQETVKLLQENRKVDLSYSCHLKKSQKDFTSAATEWQQEQLPSLPVSEADTVAVLADSPRQFPRLFIKDTECILKQTITF